MVDAYLVRRLFCLTNGLSSMSGGRLRDILSCECTSHARLGATGLGDLLVLVLVDVAGAGSAMIRGSSKVAK